MPDKETKLHELPEDKIREWARRCGQLLKERGTSGKQQSQISGLSTSTVSRIINGREEPKRNTLIAFLLKVIPEIKHLDKEFYYKLQPYLDAPAKPSQELAQTWDIFYLQAKKFRPKQSKVFRAARLTIESGGKGILTIGDPIENRTMEVATMPALVDARTTKSDPFQKAWHLMFVPPETRDEKVVLGSLMRHHPHIGVVHSACILLRTEIQKPYLYRYTIDDLPANTRDIVPILADASLFRLGDIQERYEQDLWSGKRHLIGIYEFYLRSTRAKKSNPFVGKLGKGYLKIDENFDCLIIKERNKGYPIGKVMLFPQNPAAMALHLNRENYRKPIRLIFTLKGLNRIGKAIWGAYSTVDEENRPEAGLVVLRKVGNLGDDIGVDDVGVKDVGKEHIHLPDDIPLYHLLDRQKSVVTFPRDFPRVVDKPCWLAGHYFFYYRYVDPGSPGESIQIRRNTLRILSNYEVEMKSEWSHYRGVITIDPNGNRFKIKVQHMGTEFRGRHIYGPVGAHLYPPEVLVSNYVSITPNLSYVTGRGIITHIDEQDLDKNEVSFSPRIYSTLDKAKEEVPKSIIRSIMNVMNDDYAYHGTIKYMSHLHSANEKEIDLSELLFQRAYYYADQLRKSSQGSDVIGNQNLNLDEVVQAWRKMRDHFPVDIEHKRGQLERLWPALKGKLK